MLAAQIFCGTGLPEGEGCRGTCPIHFWTSWEGRHWCPSKCSVPTAVKLLSPFPPPHIQRKEWVQCKVITLDHPRSPTMNNTTDRCVSGEESSCQCRSRRSPKVPWRLQQCGARWTSMWRNGKTHRGGLSAHSMERKMTNYHPSNKPPGPALHPKFRLFQTMGVHWTWCFTEMCSNGDRNSGQFPTFVKRVLLDMAHTHFAK